MPWQQSGMPATQHYFSHTGKNGAAQRSCPKFKERKGMRFLPHILS